MYLLATITLYFTAYSVITLLFAYINVGFPDALDAMYGGVGDTIRWSLALLIIIFPVYLWVSRFLHRDMVADPGKQDIKIRKWLLYLTLFLAAILAIGDLVALIYNFLQGEITMRFILKVVSVFAVAAGVFWYYLYDLRRAPGPLAPKAKWFVWGVIAAMIAIIVCGIVVAGSPFKQRLVKFDIQKVNDLQEIQSQTIFYWQQKQKLPATLGDLTDSISGFKAPTDPQSGASYEYRTTGTLSFQLCADFNVSSGDAQVGAIRAVPAYPMGVSGGTDNWQHGAGTQCFDRTIDPQLYKPTVTK